MFFCVLRPRAGRFSRYCMQKQTQKEWHKSKKVKNICSLLQKSNIINGMFGLLIQFHQNAHTENISICLHLKQAILWCHSVLSPINLLSCVVSSTRKNFQQFVYNWKNSLCVVISPLIVKKQYQYKTRPFCSPNVCLNANNPCDKCMKIKFKLLLWGKNNLLWDK